MGRVILDMSMSLDGFIAGPKDDDKPDRELQALESLHNWMFSGKTEREAAVWEEAYFKTTGGIVIGRRTFEVGVGPWGDNPTFHAPCFVLSKDAKRSSRKVERRILSSRTVLKARLKKHEQPPVKQSPPAAPVIRTAPRHG
jgi:dihydrofolate reductase